LPYITIACCFDSHPRIDSVFQESWLRQGHLKNATVRNRFNVGCEIEDFTLPNAHSNHCAVGEERVRECTQPGNRGL
jgi:hypothetical protein